MKSLEKQVLLASKVAQAAKMAGLKIGCEYHEFTSINIEGQLMDAIA